MVSFLEIARAEVTGPSSHFFRVQQLDYRYFNRLASSEISTFDLFVCYLIKHIECKNYPGSISIICTVIYKLRSKLVHQ
jgi:hypothetical protein